MLNDVATVDDPGRALFEQSFRPCEDLGFRRLAAAANEYGYAARNFDDFMVDRDIGGWIGFHDVGSQFHGLTNERNNFRGIAIDHITTGFDIGLKNERFYHQWHPVVIALGFEFEDIADALIRDFRLIGNLKQVYHHAGGVEPDRL